MSPEKRRVAKLTNEIRELLEDDVFRGADVFLRAEDKQSLETELVEWCTQYNLHSLQVVWDTSHQNGFCTLDGKLKNNRTLTHFLRIALAKKCRPRIEKTFFVDGYQLHIKTEQQFQAFLKQS